MKRLTLAVALLAGVLAYSAPASAQDHVPPSAVSDLGVVFGKTTAVVTWTSPADQCNGNDVSQYELRYSTSAITECNFSSATQVTTSTPLSAGSAECYSITGLTCNHTYYFALRSKDSSGNWSVLSNIVSGTTESCVSSHEVHCLWLGPDRSAESACPLPAAAGMLT